MPGLFTGENGSSLDELEKLFEDDEQQESPLADDGTTSEPSNEPTQTEDVSTTKAFAKRLAQEKAKIASEEREAIAKSLGYNSYEELQKSRERKVYEDKGLDPDEVSPIVDQLVKERLDNDPRMKELEALKAKQVKEFAKQELAEITKLTGGEITKIEQIPREVIELWKTKGSLKAAYLELKGEELIMRERSKQSKGSTDHLANATSSGSGENGKRHLTPDEKRVWKLFNPSLTDEELNKKLVNK